MIRILITGCREWECHELARRVVKRLIARYGENITIVHGACRGADTAFACAATLNNVTQEPHRAEEFGRWPACGPKRNAHMASLGATLCIAVHRDINASKGTKDCARQCLAAGIPTYLIDSEDGEPKRLREIP